MTVADKVNIVLSEKKIYTFLIKVTFDVDVLLHSYVAHAGLSMSPYIHLGECMCTYTLHFVWD